MTCIANTWTGWLDTHWQKPSDSLDEEPMVTQEDREGCLEILCTPKDIYKTDFRCAYDRNLPDMQTDGDDCPLYTSRTKLQFAIACVAAPLMTQAFVNEKANDAFGEMREAHGFKEKLVKPLKAAALQLAALANYTWTVILGLIPIPQYFIAAAVALVAVGILKGINRCAQSETIDEISGKLLKFAAVSILMFIPSLYGVPRAALGVFQKIGTLGLIPTYLAGRAIIDCKNAIKDCSCHLDCKRKKEIDFE